MYCKFYGLTVEPFENTPDPDFLYLSKNHREVLAAMNYGIKAGKGFVLVVGDVGTGKTTLIHALMKQIDPEYIVIHIINPRISFQEIVAEIARKLGVAHREGQVHGLVEVIQSRLVRLAEQGKPVVLVIDEAHHLSLDSLEELRLISNIESEKKKLIQIALVGQIELYRTLLRDELKQLKQRIVLHRRLLALEQNETIKYIEHRLKVAGRNTPLFNNKALNLIWKRSNGIPRVINQLCDNSLIIGLATNATTIGPRIVEEAIDDMDTGGLSAKKPVLFRWFNWKFIAATAAVVVFALLFLYWNTGQLNRHFAPFRASLSKKLPAAEAASANKEKEHIDRARLTATGDAGSTGASEPAETSEQTDLVVGESITDLASAAEQAETMGEEFKPEVATLAEPTAVVDETSETDRAGELERTEMISQQLKANGGTGEAAVELAGAGIEPEVAVIEPDTVIIPQLLQNSDNTQQTEHRRVQPDDYLAKIAFRKYGIANDTIYDLIQMVNPQIHDVDLIYPDQLITLPPIKKKNLIVKDGKGNYYIHYASFYSVARAQTALNRLKLRRQGVFLLTAQMGRYLIYRIYFGSYAEYAEAEQAIGKIDFEFLPFLNSITQATAE